MKLIPVVCALLFILISCNKHAEKDIYQDYQGRWDLIKMSGNIPNSETTGQEMMWQESYTFNSNGTFSKLREQNSTVTEVSGTFSVLISKEGTSLELIHASENNIIGSCLGNQKEVLFLKSKMFLTSTWNQCDGPGLEYEKAIHVD